jgi:hypothetical protein
MDGCCRVKPNFSRSIPSCRKVSSWSQFSWDRIECFPPHRARVRGVVGLGRGSRCGGRLLFSVRSRRARDRIGDSALVRTQLPKRALQQRQPVPREHDWRREEPKALDRVFSLRRWTARAGPSTRTVSPGCKPARQVRVSMRRGRLPAAYEGLITHAEAMGKHDIGRSCRRTRAGARHAAGGKQATERLAQEQIGRAA